ncbi:transposase (fragment) [Nitrosomonas mobilis]|uniref:Transposase n=1 Tax=Nitrosomonas mobilis TaxID=51642 RepID=A0A1G5SIX7_9PROT
MRQRLCGPALCTGCARILVAHMQIQIVKRSELHTFKVMPKR